MWLYIVMYFTQNQHFIMTQNTDQYEIKGTTRFLMCQVQWNDIVSDSVN